MSASKAGFVEMLKGFLQGYKLSAAALADLAEEAGDDEFAAQLRDGSLHFRFDERMARGGLTVRRTSHGPEFYLDNVKPFDGQAVAIGYVNMFPASPKNVEDYEKAFEIPDRRPCLTLYDPRMREAAVEVRYDSWGMMEITVNGALRVESLGDPPMHHLRWPDDHDEGVAADEMGNIESDIDTYPDDGIPF